LYPKPCLFAIALSIILGFCLAGVIGFYNIRIEALEEDIEELQNRINEIGTTQVEGPLTMKFTAKNQTLYVLARINDDDYNARDFLGLAFDKNNDNNLTNEDVVMLYADNTTKPAFLDENGNLMIPLLPREPSTVHTCTFEDGVGYTFNVTLHFNTFPSDLTYVCFGDAGLHEERVIHTEFHIGINW